MKVRLTLGAARDLRQMSEYVRSENPPASIRVEQALQDALELLSNHPYAGRPQERGIRRFSVPRYPYLVFYWVDETSHVVGVVSIRHAARKPQAW